MDCQSIRPGVSVGDDGQIFHDSKGAKETKTDAKQST